MMFGKTSRRAQKNEWGKKNQKDKNNRRVYSIFIGKTCFYVVNSIVMK